MGAALPTVILRQTGSPKVAVESRPPIQPAILLPAVLSIAGVRRTGTVASRPGSLHYRWPRAP